MHLYFAPIQGYTTALYRRMHHAIWGGISYYYTPFVRIEKGEFRRRDIADIAPENNTATPVVPQMLPRDSEELKQLTELFMLNGYRQADINMGCPFPPVALHGRGSGLLPHKERVAELMDATKSYPEMAFSVKMRLGWQSPDEWKEIIEVLNEAPLTHISIHPRIGKQQYKGSVDMNSFDEFYHRCTHPIIYNGDMESVADIRAIAAEYPQLRGIMIGRGLLARPYLTRLLQENTSYNQSSIIEETYKFHQAIYAHLETTSQGNSQLMQRLHAQWEYLLPNAPHKERKAIIKSSNPRQYVEAVEKLFNKWLSQSREESCL